jgi:hypothetical protein
MATIVLKPLMAFAFFLYCRGPCDSFCFTCAFSLSISYVPFFSWCAEKYGNKTFGSQTHLEKQVEKHNISRYPKYPYTFIWSLFINCCVILHIAMLVLLKDPMILNVLLFLTKFEPML